MKCNEKYGVKNEALMNSYIFITKEGSTFQPNSQSPEADIDNCQVIGFGEGIDENDAFHNCIEENEYLLDSTFNEIICIRLKHKNYYGESKYFYINDYRKL